MPVVPQVCGDLTYAGEGVKGIILRQMREREKEKRSGCIGYLYLLYCLLYTRTAVTGFDDRRLKSGTKHGEQRLSRSN